MRDSLIRAEISLIADLNYARIGIAIMFVVAVLVHPFVINPMSLLWRRIVESDKPVFTLVFGGIGGFTSLLREALQRF